jgi:hypothetical protein
MVQTGRDTQVEQAGLRLKRRREELELRYRDVEEASQKIAERRNSDEFIIALSRLADIENKGTVPSIYRLYSLCAIYRLDFVEVLEWYGIDLSMLPADGLTADTPKTHMIRSRTDVNGLVTVPLALDPGVDPQRTTYLSRHIGRWGKLPLMLLNAVDPRNWRYAWVGSEDWSMYPVLQPGSLLLIDETRRRIQNSGWTSDYDRPIYLIEHRGGYALGWCTIANGLLVVQPHPASQAPPQLFRLPEEAEIVGVVAGVANWFESRPKTRP